MKNFAALWLALSLLLAPAPSRAGLVFADDDVAEAETSWGRFLADARSAPATPPATNAVTYRKNKPEKQVPLKSVDWSTVKSMRLLTHANIPMKVLMACIDKTRDEVQEMLAVVKQVNEEEHLPADERIKLHLICDSEASFRKVSVSQADFDQYVEVDRYFYTTSSDVWMQDWGEIAMVDTPGEKKSQLLILDTNRARASLSELPGTLARMWNGYYYQKPTPSRTSSGDYGGNIEVTPDGVLMIGSTSSEELRGILGKGYAGRTAVLDTNWLRVGHVDEYLSTIPTPAAARGYVIVKADPRAGLARIAGLSREQLDAEMRDYVHTLHKASALAANAGYFDREGKNSRRTFALLYAYHAFANHYELDLAHVAASTGTTMEEAGRLAADNAKIGANIDAQVEILKNTIRASTGDAQTEFTVVSLPSIFEPLSSRGTTAALLPGGANLVVLRNHVVVPDPLVNCFRTDIKAALTKVGLKPHLIADPSYHNLDGQLHCGTNVLRHPNKWLNNPSLRPARVQRFQDMMQPVH